MGLAKYMVVYSVCIAALIFSAHALKCLKCDNSDKDCYSGKTNSTCEAKEKQGCIAFTYNDTKTERGCLNNFDTFCEKTKTILTKENITNLQCQACNGTDLCNSVNFNSANFNSAHHLNVPFISVALGTIISLYIFK